MRNTENKSNNPLNLQRQAELFIAVLLLTATFVYLFDIIPYDFSTELTALCEAGIFALVVLPSVVAYRICGGSLKGLFKWEKGQGRLIAVLLLARLAILAFLHVTGLSVIGAGFIYRPVLPFIFLVKNVFVIGVCEEFIFRVYMQETLAAWLGKYRVLAPFFAALIFGAYHLINSGSFTAALSFVMGLIWGYTRFFNKKCTFTVLFISHGLSNYLGYLLSVLYGFILYGGNPLNIGL